MGWHGGFPTGRPWVFAIPSPFLGSAPLGIPLPEHSRHVGLDPIMDGRLSLHGDRTTGGDSNPDCPFRRFHASRSDGLVAGRRLSPCPLFIASHGLSRTESRSRLSGAFSFFAGHFRVRRHGEYIGLQANGLVFSRIHYGVLRRLAQVLAGKGAAPCTIQCITRSHGKLPPAPRRR